MLENSPARAQGETEWESLPSHNRQLLHLADVHTALKRSFWIVLACPLVAVAIASFYLVGTPPSYVASAQLLIEAAKQQLLWRDNNTVDLTVDNAQVESQVEIIRSERVANDVIASLGLVDDPEFRSGTAASDYQLRRIALNRFKDALSTRRIGQSYVIEISFRSTDPEKAARITNAITEAYIRDQLRAKTEAAQQATRWMQDRVTELGVELNTAAAAVQKYRAATGITTTDNNGQSRLLDKLTELEARAEAYRKLYESFVQRLTENRQQESYPVSNARVIAEASTPLVKSYPKTALILLLSVLLGLLAGAGIAAARSMLDQTVRSARQIREVLGIACLSSLPRFPGARGGPASPGQQLLGAPFSPFAQGLRSIKLSLQSAGAQSADAQSADAQSAGEQNAGAGKVGLRIGVLSLGPGEGTTTIAASLAALFARSGDKPLLIDADFRNPSLSRSLVPNAKRGLIEALESEAAEGAIVFEPKTRTHVLPIVNGEHVADSADLLGSAAMRQLLQQLDASFGTIIVDLPSLRSAVDARAIGPLLDGCILVVEWGRTPIEGLTDAVAQLRAGHIQLLGAVLNKVADGIPMPFVRAAAERAEGPPPGYEARPIEARS